MCPTGYGLDVLGTTCFLCDEGWAGGGCSMCQNDQACRARGDSSSAAQCLQTAIYQQKVSASGPSGLPRGPAAAPWCCSLVGRQHLVGTRRVGAVPARVVQSTVKNYTCAITDESTRSLLGNTVRFSCSTLPPANASLVTGESKAASLSSYSCAQAATGRLLRALCTPHQQARHLT